MQDWFFLIFSPLKSLSLTPPGTNMRPNDYLPHLCPSVNDETFISYFSRTLSLNVVFTWWRGLSAEVTPEPTNLLSLSWGLVIVHEIQTD